jgi:hypothetical protein
MAKGVTIEVFAEDKLRIKELCDKLSAEYGFKVGYRIALMQAVNKLMEEK